MIDRIFEILMELDENQVTLSPILVKHMLKHNRKGRGSLVVMPIRKTDKDGNVEMIGLDINPPYEIADAKYQQSLSEIQYDPKSKLTGFQMEDPTVVGLWNQYGMSVDTDGAEKMKQRMHVLAKKQCGRWMYWILPQAKCKEDYDRLQIKLKWTTWFVKVGIM